jgi:hypothetical protein
VQWRNLELPSQELSSCYVFLRNPKSPPVVTCFYGIPWALQLLRVFTNPILFVLHWILLQLSQPGPKIINLRLETISANQMLETLDWSPDLVLWSWALFSVLRELLTGLHPEGKDRKYLKDLEKHEVLALAQVGIFLLILL